MNADQRHEQMMCGEWPKTGLIEELEFKLGIAQAREDLRMRALMPQCLYDGCTGATVRHRGARFCSDLCARLYGEQQADRYSWCVQCVQWHDESCEVTI